MFSAIVSGFRHQQRTSQSEQSRLGADVAGRRRERRTGSRKGLSALALAALPLIAIPASPVGAQSVNGNVTLSMGQPETVLDLLHRWLNGLIFWPDSQMGLLREGNSWVTFASSASLVPHTTMEARAVGSPDDPLAGGHMATPILGVPSDIAYAAGGHVYRDPATGMLLMFVHTERWPQTVLGVPFYATLALAKSTDDGVTWTWLGEIISPNLSYSAVSPSDNLGFGPGSGTYTIRNGYFYVYYSWDPQATNGQWDPNAPNAIVWVAVARAPVQEVVAAAAAGHTSPWFKFYQGSFSEPGLGGRASDLVPSGCIFEPDITYDQYVQEYVMVAMSCGGTPPPPPGAYNLTALFSSDGMSWTGRQELVTDDGVTHLYPTIWPVGSGSVGQGTTTSGRFFVFYLASALERQLPGIGNRWMDGAVVRRLVRVDLTSLVGSSSRVASGVVTRARLASGVVGASAAAPTVPWWDRFSASSRWNGMATTSSRSNGVTAGPDPLVRDSGENTAPRPLIGLPNTQSNTQGGGATSLAAATSVTTAVVSLAVALRMRRKLSWLGNASRAGQ
jgi:hypothetical protein